LCCIHGIHHTACYSVLLMTGDQWANDFAAEQKFDAEIVTAGAQAVDDHDGDQWTRDYLGMLIIHPSLATKISYGGYTTRLTSRCFVTRARASSCSACVLWLSDYNYHCCILQKRMLRVMSSRTLTLRMCGTKPRRTRSTRSAEVRSSHVALTWTRCVCW